MRSLVEPRGELIGVQGRSGPKHGETPSKQCFQQFLVMFWHMNRTFGNETSRRLENKYDWCARKVTGYSGAFLALLWVNIAQNTAET